MNVLFIMCDQLRFDYLGCTGHPSLKTPNIDKMAARGVRFSQAYVQSPICGPSRMSFYTGRYVRSHGSTWNNFPLRVGEMTIGDHLKPLGLRTVLCGKTHMAADVEGLKRLGIDPNSGIGSKIAECGFEIWDRLDGLHPTGGKQPSHYNDHLSGLGYDGPNPWDQWANSAADTSDISNAASEKDVDILSGWLFSHADKPARIDEKDSETPYTTDRAIEFIEQAGDEPWCLHLSYIKPHWPYIVPEPYHNMYGEDDVIPVVRSDEEKINPHPILNAYHQHRFSKVYDREGARERVIPAYMGLIKQIDDQMGRLMAYLDEKDIAKDTLIIFTSDHGDYLGDHWLGEKELFHEQSVKIPLIVIDPSKDADKTRGTVNDSLVEAIDLLPTFVDFVGGKIPTHILEGSSLLQHIRQVDGINKREFVISEYDYSMRKARKIMGQEIKDSRLVMIFDGRFKMTHVEGYRPMLFDLKTDPNEFNDLGESDAHKDIRSDLLEKLFGWSRQHHNRVTTSAA
ncbi:MAG: sulfatase-like hydrolase/transferase, partial [Rhizobiales bacterium]|nr:sulfatase-like hydrolase/transferase [Hyphomicrobiales bacterium]